MKKERVSSVEEMIKKSVKIKDEHETEIKAEETLKKAALVLNKKLGVVQHTTGENPDQVSEKMVVNGHSVELGLKRAPGETGNTAHYSFYMTVDGKNYTDKEEMKKAIVMVDTGKGLAGMEKVKHESAKAGEELKKTLHRDAPVLRRTCLISACRKVEHASKEAVHSGESILAKLLAILGRTLTGPGR